MPVPTTRALQQSLPKTEIFLMYGLTEAFRSTYLPPDQVDIRPESMVVSSLCASGLSYHGHKASKIGEWSWPAPGFADEIMGPNDRARSGSPVSQER